MLFRSAGGSVGVGVSRVAGEGCLCCTLDQSQRAGGRDARGSVGVGVGWVAGEAGGHRRGCDESQRAGGGDAGGAVRVRVSWVAGKASACRCSGDEGKGAVCGNTGCTIRVGVCWVACEALSSVGGCGSDQSEVTVCRDALDALRVLVSRVAGVVERAGGREAHGGEDSESLTHVV